MSRSSYVERAKEEEGRFEKKNKLEKYLKITFI